MAWLGNGALINSLATPASFSGAITLAADATIGGTGKMTLLEAISGAFRMSKEGTGTLVLSNAASTYNGGTVVSEGLLELNRTTPGTILAAGSSLNIGAGATVRLTGDQFNILGNDVTRIGLITIDTGGILSADATVNNAHNIGDAVLNGGTLTAGDGDDGGFGNFVISGTVSHFGDVASNITAARIGLKGSVFFDVADGAAATDLEITSSLINGGGADGLIKAGSGKARLSGASTYTGDTTVAAGTLAVSGSINGSVNLEVQFGATLDVAEVANGFIVGATQTLKGEGTIVGDTTVDGTLAPGSFSTSTLSFSNDLALAGTAEFEISRFSDVLGADLANVAGALTLGGTLNVLSGGEPLLLGDTFDLFDAPNFSGTFTDVILPLLDPGLAWNSENLAVDGTLIVVPEPGSAMMALFGGLSLAIGLRRRRIV